MEDISLSRAALVEEIIFLETKETTLSLKSNQKSLLNLFRKKNLIMNLIQI